MANAGKRLKCWVGVIGLQARVRRVTGGGNVGTVFDPVLSIGNNELAIADGGDIVVDGVTNSQIIDLYNYWMALKIPAGATYQKARVEAASTVLDAESAWRMAA